MLKDRTLKSILEDPAIAGIALHAISGRDLTKEEFYNRTLREIADGMGWRSLERGFERLFRAAAGGEYVYRLYSEEECAQAPEKKNTNIVWLPSDDARADSRPFILLVPGGGFASVWNLTEGWPTAQRFNELGYHVFVLTYQVNVDGAAVRAMDDMARAMEIIASRREEFHVDPESYITCGFSAGGYVICLWNTKKGFGAFDLPAPRACFPVYPVTSYRLLDTDEWEEGEDKDEFARSGTGCTMSESCSSCFEIPLYAAGFPPTAVFAAEDDEMVDPEHSKCLARALDEAGIPCRIEIGPTGGHGFGDGDGTSLEGWPERAAEWYESIK